jgi:putative Mg2+ transporter-C (MgtC) family protein
MYIQIINFLIEEFNVTDIKLIIQVAIRSFFAVVIGTVIGSERARHGRAAGMRTHILVCLGATLTSMIGVYLNIKYQNQIDVARLSAQVISGVGFLGAGMIILKNNNIITGLTTAAGVWTTSIIGIALGFGFYFGAIIVFVIYIMTIIVLGKFEKSKRINSNTIYFEINDIGKTNEIINTIESEYDITTSFHTIPAKSGVTGNLGIVVIDTSNKIDLDSLLKNENIVFAEIE